MTKPQISWQRPFLLCFFCLHPWICRHKSRSAPHNPVVPPPPPPPRRGSCPRTKIVPQKQATRPEPCRPIWDKDFFLVFTSKFKGKIILCLANIIRAPTPPLPRSRYSGAAPGCKIAQSCMSITRRQKILLKTASISIEKHVKTACWQLSTYVPIKSRKNTVVIRVKTFKIV